jgi:tryptophanyl-tRNA synthetase
LKIFSDVTQTPIEKILDQMAGKDFSFFKKELSDALVTNICPIGDEIKKLLSNRSHLEAVLKKGKEKAQLKAEENLKKIRDIVGLL